MIDGLSGIALKGRVLLDGRLDRGIKGRRSSRLALAAGSVGEGP